MTLGQAARARHDVRFSALTLLVGAALGVVTTRLVLDGAITLSTANPSAARFAFEVGLYVLLFDAYFYGLHRLLHTRPLFRRVHAVHHRSRTPSVFTALAFHPLEALAILGFVPAALWLLPIHLLSLAVVSAFLSGSLLLAHAARDPFPSWWHRTPGLRTYVTPRVHHAHHARRDCNYSATFMLFDRLFGTLRVEAPPRA
jgi:sterol desaturase/sphingolipid hydroxylase (fatty acid hydroxylase superfamily)